MKKYYRVERFVDLEYYRGRLFFLLGGQFHIGRAIFSIIYFSGDGFWNGIKICKSVSRLDETGGSLNFISGIIIEDGKDRSDNDRCTHTITRNLSHLSSSDIVDAGYVLEARFRVYRVCIRYFKAARFLSSATMIDARSCDE